MKKVIFGFALLTCSVIANAQTEGYSKNSTFLTGSVGISSKNDKDELTKSSSFNFTPTVGHFLSDNVAVGVGLGIGSDKVTVDGTTESEKSTFNVGAFGRYYFSPKSKFSMFGHLGVNYNSSTEKIPTPEVKTTGMDVFVAPGFNYFISNKLALEAVIGRLGYSTSKTDESGAKGSTNFGLDLNLSSIAFGINYKF